MACQSHDVDVLIFGGGGAGLWLLDALHRRGLAVRLLEAAKLGTGQTIASQGIIHGGLKYTLRGLLTPSARAIRAMPRRWRACLAGQDQPDLTHTRLRAEFCYLWHSGSITSKLALAGARTALEVRPVALDRGRWPAVLAQCPQVLRLDEQVIDPASFLADLAGRHRPRLMQIDASEAALAFEMDHDRVRAVRLGRPGGGKEVRLCPQVVVLTAGLGNATLRRRVGLAPQAMQCRPLHMVMLRSAALPVLHGHCVDGAATRVTITTDRMADGQIVWQVGGRIAEQGVELDGRALIDLARSELAATVPGLAMHDVQWSSYRVDRAEAADAGRRPDDVSVRREGNVMTAWPTKLALVPRLVEQIEAQLADVRPTADDELTSALHDWPVPDVAPPPWETQTQWIAGD